MPIQKDNKLFPTLLPPPPKEEKELLQWAFDISKIYSEFSKQVIETFNLHLDQTHAHAKSWTTWRLPRPRFHPDPSDSLKILVPASSTQPILFKIGDRLLEATSTLVCDFNSGTGPGHLDSGTFSSAKVYYLYGIYDSGAVALICSLTDPRSGGPAGYDEWTYLGAFPSLDTSAVLTDFIFCDGVLTDNGYFHVITHNTITPTAYTVPLPITARFQYWMINLSVIGGAGQAGNLLSQASVDHSYPLWSRAITGTYDEINTGWLPVRSEKTVYAVVTNAATTVRGWLMGWIEDPTEYP